MIDEKMETISAKLRSWADDDYEGKYSPIAQARDHYGIDGTVTWQDLSEVFRKIADDIDREMDELRDQLQQAGGIPIEDVVHQIATCDKNDSAFDPLKAAISKYFLPRPLFDDGEPAQFGDIFVRDFGRDAKIDSLSYTKGNSDYVNINGYERHDLDHRLKRPKPQVLDVDGVPIGIGDKVWLLPGEHCDSFPLYGYYACREYEVVKNNNPGHRADGRICITGGDLPHGYPMPERVAHSKPDSLVGLRDDMLEWSERGIIPCSMREIAGRLSALIDLYGEVDA